MRIPGYFFLLSAFFLTCLAGGTPTFAAGQVGDRPPPQSPAAKSPYRIIDWNDLMPKGWNPMKGFEKFDFDSMKDSDPRAQEALKRLRKAWSKAPVEPSMNGARVSIPGFIVPLEQVRHQITEFLLIPYYGGCIHVPAPPTNQIIHVFPVKPLTGRKSMDSVMISGVLETIPSETRMGNAGYRMKAEVIVPYRN
ncbi:MAG: DUF3299 domain-containing protein [Gallionella sp.]